MADQNNSPPTAFRSYKLLVLSNIFFVIASVCYFAGAILDLKENKKAVADQEVTLSWVLILMGGIGFVILGAIDLYNTQNKIHILLILAGVFAALKSLLQKSNLTVALVCNLLSAHLFLSEAVQRGYEHVFHSDLTKDDSRQRSLKFAKFGDFCFFTGALMDVLLSYYVLIRKQSTLVATQTETTAGLDVASAFFWLVASLVALTIALRLGKQGFAGAATGNDASGTKVPQGSIA